ncbi:hypothetical protein V8C37DRAFT_409514 [Trichoderma ceciliae]
MPIRVIIVGAGIGGLTTAVSLRQAGCEVTVFEKSAFVGEIGAALALTPNGARILERLGFSFAKARTCNIKTWNTIDGVTYNTLNSLDLSNSEQVFGTPLRTVHRVDLHNELLRLATTPGQGLSRPVTLKLSCQVVEAHYDGTVILHDGSRYSADVVVGADGLRSVVRDAVLGAGASAKPIHSGQAAFRFLVNTSTLKNDPALASMTCENQEKLCLFADTSEIERERHMIWYACRDGEVQNFVGIHPSVEVTTEEGQDAKVSMKAEFSHFHEKINRILEIAENVKRWPLFIHDPYPTWVNGRIVLVGDAAHPMLPFGGQGAMMAIEDGGILGSLLTNLAPNQIDARLSNYQNLRKNRASRIQLLSNVRVGREAEVEAQVRQYADGPDYSVPTSHKERTMHDYR